MRYEINDDLEIRVYKDGQAQPFLIQPDWPDTTPWESREQAQAWAEQFILSQQDPEADVAGDNPSQPTRSRPIQDILEQYKINPQDYEAIQTAIQERSN